MNKKLKSIGLLLGILYLFFLGYTFYEGIPEFISGFKSGVKSTEEKTHSSTSYVYFKVKPKDMDTNYFPTQIKDESGQMLYVNVSDISLEMPGVKRSVLLTIVHVVIMILTLSLIFVIFFLPYLVYKVFYSIIKKDIFDPDNYSIFNKIGFTVIYFYVVTLLIGLEHYFDAKQFVQLADYRIIFDFSEGIYILFLGVFSLFFAEILKIATRMKEERDLTI